MNWGIKALLDGIGYTGGLGCLGYMIYLIIDSLATGKALQCLNFWSVGNEGYWELALFLVAFAALLRLAWIEARREKC